MTTCKACEAPMTFAVVERSGAVLPLDAAPLLQPEVRMLPPRVLIYRQETRDGKLYADPVGRGGDDITTPVYVSHFVTCPEAGKFSKGRKR